MLINLGKIKTFVQKYHILIICVLLFLLFSGYCKVENFSLEEMSDEEKAEYSKKLALYKIDYEKLLNINGQITDDPETPEDELQEANNAWHAKNTDQKASKTAEPCDIDSGLCSPEAPIPVSQPEELTTYNYYKSVLMNAIWGN